MLTTRRRKRRERVENNGISQISSRIMQPWQPPSLQNKELLRLCCSIESGKIRRTGNNDGPLARPASGMRCGVPGTRDGNPRGWGISRNVAIEGKSDSFMKMRRLGTVTH